MDQIKTNLIGHGKVLEIDESHFAIKFACQLAVFALSEVEIIIFAEDVVLGYYICELRIAQLSLDDEAVVRKKLACDYFSH